jgi:hypothetical protein
MGTGGSFPGGKAWPGRDADHSPPSRAKVKNEKELYLLSPHVPPWRVAGQLYFCFFKLYSSISLCHFEFLNCFNVHFKRSFVLEHLKCFLYKVISPLSNSGSVFL